MATGLPLFVIKRKLQGALSGDIDSQGMSVLKSVLSVPDALSDIDFDNLIVNSLITRKYLKIPVGTDKFRSGISLHDYYHGESSILDENFGMNDATQWIGQTFTPGDSHIITQLKVKCFRSGSPGTITFSIRATSGGLPTGNDLATGTLDGDSIITGSGNAVWYTISLGSGTTLVGGTKYAICIRISAPAGSDQFVTKGEDDSPSYSGGSYVSSTNSGATWSATTGWDLGFEEWGRTNQGDIWMEGNNLHGIDENFYERIYLHQDDVDDAPVDAATTAPISSNWAYDHENAADPHTGYRLESADHSHQSTGAQAGQLDHGLALTGLGDDDHTQYIKHSLATAANDFLVASGSGVYVKKTLAETITILGMPQFAKSLVIIDLSGGAVSAIPILHTSRALTLLKAIILYTEASSADAGVLIEIGKESDADYYYTGTSETNQALWYEKDVTLLQTDIAAGDTVICGCAGGKTGTGEVLVVIEFKVA